LTITVCASVPSKRKGVLHVIDETDYAQRKLKVMRHLERRATESADRLDEAISQLVGVVESIGGVITDEEILAMIDDAGESTREIDEATQLFHETTEELRQMRHEMSPMGDKPEPAPEPPAGHWTDPLSILAFPRFNHRQEAI
jgi:hypothetical protein